MKEKEGLTLKSHFIPASHDVLGGVWVLTHGMAHEPPEMASEIFNDLGGNCLKFVCVLCIHVCILTQADEMPGTKWGVGDKRLLQTTAVITNLTPGDLPEN